MTEDVHAARRQRFEGSRRVSMATLVIGGTSLTVATGLALQFAGQQASATKQADPTPPSTALLGQAGAGDQPAAPQVRSEPRTTRKTPSRPHRTHHAAPQAPLTPPVQAPVYQPPPPAYQPPVQQQAPNATSGGS